MKLINRIALLAACPLFLGSFHTHIAPAPAPAPVQTAPALVEIAMASSSLSPDQLTAQSAILIDAHSGQVLFEKNADERRAPASTTKIMTLLLAVEKMDPDKTVTVPDSAGKAPADSTRVPVYPGEIMPFSDLLHGLMIKSGNDAANAIGTLASGSVDSFVSQMNQRARQMGLENTHFENAHGYPASGHYTTARDLARIMQKAMENPAFRKVISARQHTMAATSLRDSLTLKNSYAIFNPQSDYYYPYALFGKTGYASSAGQCFVCAAQKEGRTLISVVLNAGGTKSPKWADTKTLFEYGFDKLGL